MASYSGQGLGYSKLTVPRDTIGESLDFMASEAGKRKAAADLANERAKVRDEEAEAGEIKRRQDELEKRKGKYDPTFSGFKTADDQNQALAGEYLTKHTGLLQKYADAQKRQDTKTMMEIDAQMKSMSNNFSKFGDVQGKLKESYDTLAKMKLEGKMSAAYDNVYNNLEHGVNGDLSKAWFSVNDDGTASGHIRKTDANGNEVIEDVDPYMYISGAMNDVGKFPFDATVDEVTEKLGEFKNSVYSKGFQIGDEGYTKAAEKYISEGIGNNINDKQVIAWAGDTKGDKFETLSKDKNLMTQRRKELITELTKAAQARENTAYSKKPETAFEELAIRKAALNKPAKPTVQQEKFGLRRQNIDDVISTNNVSDFKSGDLEYGGVKYRATDAKITPDDKIVVYVTDEKGKNPKTIVVDKTQMGINELYNAFEKSTNWSVDKVYSPDVQPVKWRDVETTGKASLGEVLKDQFDGKNFIGDDDDIATRLKSIYPSAIIETPMTLDEKITVNGVEIDLDDSQTNIEKKILKAIGNTPATGGQQTQSTSGTVQGGTVR